MFSQDRISPSDPVYMQVLQDMRRKIVSGQWPAGMQIPPLRVLSVEFGANPNTAQRALSILEQEGLGVYDTQDGWHYVTTDAQRIAEVQTSMAMDCADSYYTAMQALGCDAGEMLRVLQEICNLREWRPMSDE